MTLSAHEFIRRSLLPVLPDGVHRIRHCGPFASAVRAANVTRPQNLIGEPDDPPEPGEANEEAPQPTRPAADAAVPA